MKILHVIPSVDVQFGGPSFAVQTMANTLIQRGCTVHIATIAHESSGHLPKFTDSLAIGRNIEYYYFRKQTTFYTFSWQLSVWLTRHIKQYEVVHIHGLFAYPTLPAAYCAWGAQIPYIIRPFGTLNRWGMQNRHPQFKKLSLRWIERPILEHAAAIQYTCEQERVEAEEVGVLGQPIILPIGVDLTTYHKLPSNEYFNAIYPELKSRVVVLFLSRFHPKKGLDLLLPAFAQVRQELPEAILVMAGDGDPDYVAHLIQQAHDLGINDHIIWAGFLEGQKKLAAMAIADVFVLPSYSENFGIAAVEAMAAGVPVIISDQVGIHREIEQARAGRIVTCCISDLATALKELLTSCEIRHQMAKQGRQLAKDFFSMETMGDRLIALYENTTRK